MLLMYRISIFVRDYRNVPVAVSFTGGLYAIQMFETRYFEFMGVRQSFLSVNVVDSHESEGMLFKFNSVLLILE